MSHVSEIMNTEVVSVRPEDSLEDVVKTLTTNEISGVPVLDDNRKVVGVISDRDLLKYSEKLRIIPLIDFSAWALPYAYSADSVIYEKNTEIFARTRTEDVMSKRVVSVKADASWHDAARLMKKHGVNRVPVVDADKKLIGIVTRTDLLNYIAEQDT